MICNRCAHERRFHILQSDGVTVCNSCFSEYFTTPEMYFDELTANHPFEDNLSFVERIAKERKLDCFMYSAKSLCLCGHYKEQHAGVMYPQCCGCNKDKNYEKYVRHEFKLDNLKYIEDLAKECNLI